MNNSFKHAPLLESVYQQHPFRRTEDLPDWEDAGPRASYARETYVGPGTFGLGQVAMPVSMGYASYDTGRFDDYSHDRYGDEYGARVRQRPVQPVANLHRRQGDARG